MRNDHNGTLSSNPPRFDDFSLIGRLGREKIFVPTLASILCLRYIPTLNRDLYGTLSSNAPRFDDFALIGRLGREKIFVRR